MVAVQVNMPPMYRKQHAAFYDPARLVTIEGSTKSGKTIGGVIWQADQSMSDLLKRNHWWVAPVYPQSEIAFRRAARMFKGLCKVNESKLTLDFEGAGRWWFKSGEKPDNLYGEDVASLVVDEFTRLREESWYALRSTITKTRGQVRFVGNVKGRGNWGYRMARKAQAGEEGYAYHKITAQDAVDAGVIKAEELKDAERDLPPAVFRELYFCEPSDDGGNPFGIAAIQRCVKPLSPLPPVCYGADLAKAVDWTVAIGLDEFGDVCRFERWQKVPWNETTHRLALLFGDLPALVDSTGVGDPIVEDLQRRCLQVEGLKFTSHSKQQLYEGLANDIHHQQVGFPEGPIVSELEVFEYEYTKTGVRYSAPEGLHDDCPTALALAKRKHHHMPIAAGVEVASARGSRTIWDDDEKEGGAWQRLDF